MQSKYLYYLFKGCRLNIGILSLTISEENKYLWVYKYAEHVIRDNLWSLSKHSSEINISLHKEWSSTKLSEELWAKRSKTSQWIILTYHLTLPFQILFLKKTWFWTSVTYTTASEQLPSANGADQMPRYILYLRSVLSLSECDNTVSDNNVTEWQRQSLLTN